MVVKLNQHLSKTVKTKTEHYNLHEVGVSAELLYKSALILVMCTY